MERYVIEIWPEPAAPGKYMAVAHAMHVEGESRALAANPAAAARAAVERLQAAIAQTESKES